MSDSPRLSTLWGLVKVRPGEERKALAMFCYLFFAVGAFIVGRISRDTLFLELPKAREALPYVYIAIAFSVAAATTVYGRLGTAVARDKMRSRALIFFAITVAALHLLMLQSKTWYWVYYVWVEVIGQLMVIQAWSMAGDIFNAREAKRLFAFIGGGGVLSNIACGFGVKQIALVIGAQGLVLVASGVILAAFLCEQWASRAAHAELASHREPPKRNVFKAKTPPLASVHLRTIAALVGLTFFVSTVVDYQFKIAAADAIADSAQRASFFGTFFGLTGILAATIQFGLTGVLLERYGVLISLLLLPLAMLTGTGAMILMPGLLAATWVKGSENVLRYTVNDATMQLLYVPVPAADRTRAKAFIDGILKPAAIGLSGIVLIGLSRYLGIQDMSWFVLAALVAWTLLVFRCKREYVRTLLTTLRRRRLDFASATLQITDDATIEALAKSLDAPNDAQVLHALELLHHVEKQSKTIKDRVVQLASSPSLQVRLAALRFLGQHGSFEDAEIIAAHLQDEAEEVRAHAILAMASLGRDHAVRTLQGSLKDPAPRVRAAAVAGLIKYGGLDGILRSAEELKAMLTHESPRVRESAAWVLGEIEVKNFYQPVLELLQDKDARVRTAAIAAAGRMKSPELIPALVYALEGARTADAAVTALVAYGEGIAPLLSKVLNNEHESLSVRRQIPKILGALGSPEVLPLLLEYLDAPDLKLRHQIIKATARLHDALPGAVVDEARVTRVVEDELRRVYRLAMLAADLQFDESDVLLKDALSTRRTQALNRIFRLLGLRYPYKTLEMVYLTLISRDITPQARANAVEVLDNILEGAPKRDLLPLVEGNAQQQLQVAREEFGLQPGTRNDALIALLDSGDEWLSVVALERLGRDKAVAHYDRIHVLLASPAPIIRETAAWVLQRLHKVTQAAPA